MSKNDKKERIPKAINPFSLNHPSTFPELISQCKYFRHSEFMHLSTFSYKQLQEVTAASFEQIKKDCTSTDSSTIINLCYIIDCLRKLCSDSRVELIEQASKLLSNRNDQVGILISYVSAKLYNKVEGTLVSSKLQDMFDKFDYGLDVLPCAYFLLFLVQHSPEAILLNWELFLKIILKAVYHKSIAIRHAAANAIRAYINLVIHRPEAILEDYVSPIFQIAVNRVNDDDVRHGNLLLFSVFLEQEKLNYYFSNPKKFIESFYNLTRIKDEAISLQALYCLAMSAKLDKKFFNSLCSASVTRILTDVCSESNSSVLAASSLLIMARSFDDFLTKGLHSCLFKIVRSMLCRNDPLKEGFELLEMISAKPSIASRMAPHLFSTLASTPITANFAHYVPLTFQHFNVSQYITQWETFCLKITSDIQDTPTVNHLHLIAQCQPFDSTPIHLALLNLLNHQNTEIRANTPAALLQNARNMKCLASIVNQLLTQTLSESVSEVRAKTLKSFPESTAIFMSSPSALSCFEALANDECYKVRKAAMILLARIVKISPFTVLPILRRVLLDDLFLLNSQRSHRIQKDMSKLLLHLILAANDILPIYSQSICQIALEHFNSPPRREQTIFERESFFDISTNISKVINIIAKKDINLVAQYFNEFIETFMYILKQHYKKELKIAAAEALTTFVSNCGSQFHIDRKAMFTELTGIASKWNSHKLNLAFLKLFGLLGAVDIDSLHSESEQIDIDEIDSDHHKYYLNVVCHTLLGVLQDSSLNTHHSETTMLLVSIFALHEESSFDWYLKFMPIFINEIRTTRSAEFLQLLQQLCQSIPPSWLTCFTDELISLIYELWGTKELLNVLGVVSSLAAVLMDRFAPFLPQCITLLLDCLFSNRASNSDISEKVLESLIALRFVSSDYMFLIIPEIVSTASSVMTLKKTRIDALDALRIFVQNCECEIFSASIIRCINYCLTFQDDVRKAALQVLYSLQVSLGSGFAHYQEIVSQELKTLHISAQMFEEISGTKPPLLLENFNFIIVEKPNRQPNTCVWRPPKPATSRQVPSINFIETKFVESETPWNLKEWFKKFVESIIVNSPEQSIATSSNLAINLTSVSESLFNAAFLSCWEKMPNDMQDTIRSTLTSALHSRHISENARSLLINLIEFMDRAEVSIGISPEILCKACKDFGHHARAFYFAHRWFQMEQTNQSSESMIRIASTLGLSQTVIGLSTLLAKGENMPPIWCEQLGYWQKALEGYSSGQAVEDISGRLRCLAHLMRWSEIIQFLPHFKDIDDAKKPDIASPLVEALYNLRKYSEIPALLANCSENDTSSYVYTAIAQFKENNKEKALETIETAFDNLARRAQTMFKHDKSMLYTTVLSSMKLTELSEIINDKMVPTVWDERLALCRKTFDVMYPVLSVRFSHSQNFEQSVLLLKRALKLNNWPLFEAIENELFPNSEGLSSSGDVTELKGDKHIEVTRIEAIAKWEQGRCQEALDQIMSVSIDDAEIKRNPILASKISFLRGQWTLRMTQPSEVVRLVDKFMPHLILATKLDRGNYKAWHRWAWASANLFHADNTDFTAAVNAIDGFMKCVQLRPVSSFSDLLQMISIFFMAKLDTDNFKDVSSLISSLDDSFILRISQHLFAQLSAEKTNTSIFVADLIKTRLPRLFHVFLYPILLLIRGGDGIEDENTNSPNAANSANSTIANDLLQNFSITNPTALNQAKIISNGLFKASCLRIERRIALLIRLSKLLNKRDFRKMTDLVNRATEEPALNNDDQLFEHRHQKDFHALSEALKRVSQFSTPSSHNALVSNMRSLYDNLKSELKSLRSIKLSDVSSDLACLADSVLAVPGTYTTSTNSATTKATTNNTASNVTTTNAANSTTTQMATMMTSGHNDVTTITSFNPVLEVIQSKQLPRLVVIKGSDGRQHTSLLKGQEDLRLDQQVMQFFELINMHIEYGFPPAHRSLRLHTYSITPLSRMSGLIQFLDGTDTLLRLVAEYRQSRGVRLDLEEEFALSTFNEAETLLPVQRLEFMRETSVQMNGNELREVIWLKSGNAMNWIARTTRFAQTSAVVSIVGYILGLGDRHPSNIMMHRLSGDVIHIDLGDCFEVGQKQMKFPEKVPFRLTRMIRNAFGPSGIEGEFRLTCENTMKLIRGHRESIMTVLDIFLQVPLEGTAVESTTTTTSSRLTSHSASSSSISLNSVASNSIPPSSVCSNSIMTTIATTMTSSGAKNEIEIEAAASAIANEDEEVKLNITQALERITDKIIGKDFDNEVELSVENQVARLIDDATDEYNLSYMYPKWYPFW